LFDFSLALREFQLSCCAHSIGSSLFSLCRLHGVHRGFGGGTWDVSVSDQFDNDVMAFKKDFPALSNASNEGDVLPAWDKQKATAWWAAH
jgi:hypothetical protein